MRFVVQRVSSASCTVFDDNAVPEVTGKIEKGFLVLIGISESDNEQIADKMIKKTNRTPDI